MIVLGGGMAGLLAASILRNKCSKIIEAQPGLPKNHSAVLRFKTSIVGDALNIPFKKVKVLKAVLPWKNPLADAMAYSMKTNGSYALRSIVSANDELVDRYIAPEDFVERMMGMVHCGIEFNQKVDGSFFKDGQPCISTLPMPTLMGLLGWTGPKPMFESLPGFAFTATIANCNLYGSLYIPTPFSDIYRVSINGNQLIAECMGMSPSKTEFSPEEAEEMVRIAANYLGIQIGMVSNIACKFQRFMKILPIEEDVRKRFIMWASDNHQVYSLGRFATWRPGLLLDDLINDVRVIQKINTFSNYEQRSGL